MWPIVIGAAPSDNGGDQQPTGETRKQRCKPESSIEPDRPADKFLGNRNRLLAKPLAALTMKNRAAGA
jgi:hypothetical protein